MGVAHNNHSQKHSLLIRHPVVTAEETAYCFRRFGVTFSARFKATSALHDKSHTETTSSTIGRLPSASNSSSKDARLLIGFTCKVCRERQHKTMSKNAYQNGVVLIQCDKCKNRHLIADNLGWFRDKKVNIEDLMNGNGEEVRRLKSMDLLDSVEASQAQEALADRELNTGPNGKKERSK
ncbi:zf-DNL-domain-containing protein [Coemansia reversa NRRL 1564]|uniref:Zf-DNL-domain-containing protein n=1 Tax=Coemansia reversa (strain ATCC 12441 / NRRL 1564) TaxID=763665 RepID=A0A2G5B6T5_COERN|nr:zf-DNL-domain-containing protein [Coemansia reversa NRRL 1564]|eukprot:PIA14719.1 zf-DNL-domain-containing protein [Coemansia reversa NRRL 1564]